MCVCMYVCTFWVELRVELRDSNGWNRERWGREKWGRERQTEVFSVSFPCKHFPKLIAAISLAITRLLLPVATDHAKVLYVLTSTLILELHT